MLRRLSLTLSLVAAVGFSASLVHFHISLAKCENVLSEHQTHIHDSESESAHDAVTCFLTSNLAKTGLSVSPACNIFTSNGESSGIVQKNQEFTYHFTSSERARAPPRLYS